MTLEAMARIWFDRSPLQHEVIVRNLIKVSRNEKCPSARTDIVTDPTKESRFVYYSTSTRDSLRDCKS